MVQICALNNNLVITFFIGVGIAHKTLIRKYLIRTHAVVTEPKIPTKLRE
jgi:hypothetical protein